MKRLNDKRRENFALVDDEDFEFLSKFKWYFSAVNQCFVTPIRLGPGNWRTQYLSRIIMERYSLIGALEEVDHKNHDRLDNRKENLRVCSQNENRQNRKCFKNCDSGEKYIHQEKNGKFRVCIGGKGKSFDNLTEAIDYRNYTAIQKYGEFACFRPRK